MGQRKARNPESWPRFTSWDRAQSPGLSHTMAAPPSCRMLVLGQPRERLSAVFGVIPTKVTWCAHTDPAAGGQNWNWSLRDPSVFEPKSGGPTAWGAPPPTMQWLRAHILKSGRQELIKWSNLKTLTRGLYSLSKPPCSLKMRTIMEPTT